MQPPQTVTWRYTANEELASKTVEAPGSTPSVTTYAYDVRGSLREVVLPDGTRISYVIDATGRRIGRKVTGVFTRKWLYQDTLRAIT